MMVNTNTVLVMSIGQQRARRSHSTYMESSMCQRHKFRKIPSMRKVNNDSDMEWFSATKLLFLVRKLSDLLAQVKDEQSYIVIRERTHRNTAESTNARVKWWSIFQMGVLLGEGLF